MKAGFPVTARKSETTARPAEKPRAAGKLAAWAKRLDGEGAGERRLLDLFLTSPVFVAYHLGVVFLSVRNGMDPITDAMLSVLHRSLAAYLGITVLIGAGLYAAIRFTKTGGKLKPIVFLGRVAEAAVYAILMMLVARSVVAHTLAAKGGGGGGGGMNPFTAFIMSMGAGFYEELAFRVLLFGGGVFLVGKVAKTPAAKLGLGIAWAFVAAACFSGIHYVGSLGDDFQLSSFVFRLVCGLFLTLVFYLRGFATAVWTHALYDVWVMVF
jgi:hypothetical protein